MDHVLVHFTLLTKSVPADNCLLVVPILLPLLLACSCVCTPASGSALLGWQQ
jgi:hypothetical protein